MKQDVLLSQECTNGAKNDYVSPLIQIEEVVVEQGYASSATSGPQRDWIYGGDLKDSYE